MRQHIGSAIALPVVVAAASIFSDAVVADQSRNGGAGDQVARGPSAPRPEDNRPPVFWREEWNHQVDRGGAPEGPVGQQHVSHPALELKHYGEAPKADPEGSQEHHHAGMWMNKRFANDPAHLFTGTCNRPCALTLRHRTQYVDLSAFGSKIRWLVKQSGFHEVRPVLKIADGTYLVGDHGDGWVEAFDWYVSEILVASVRWRRLDPERVVTMLGGRANAVGWVEKPDLSRVDEVGFADLMPGSGHGNGGFSDVAWIEVHGRPVPR
jgi:hypothetical protein